MNLFLGKFFKCPSVFLLFILLGCSSGGSGGGVPGSGSGTVVVLLSDGPALQLENVFIEITRVTLLGEGDQNRVVIFEGNQRIDLLQFREEDFLLASDDQVPAGDYEKIRLEFLGVELEPEVLCPAVKVPSNKIDLNPRGPFHVGPEAAVFVRLDVDVEKSLFIHQTGEDRCIFRPVVFVDIMIGEFEAECPQEVAGTIVEIIEDDDGDDGDDDDELAELVLDLGSGSTIRVEVKTDTAIFDENALGTDLAGLGLDDRVLVRGELENDGEIEAIWIIRGDPQEVRGTFETPIVDGMFTFSNDEPLEGLTTADTLAFFECDDTLEPLGNIAADQEARLLGARIQDGEMTFFRAAVIDLGPREVSGEIIALDDFGNVTIRLDDESIVEFHFDAGTEIKLVGDGPLTAENLRIGQTITAALEADKDRATRVEVEPEKAEGVVEALDGISGFILFSEMFPDPDTPLLETMVTVDPFATVLLILGDEEILQVGLEEVMNGDQVELFGVVPELGFFDARTVVIRR